MQKPTMQCATTKESYDAPEVEISLFCVSDVVITSDTGNDGEWDF